MSQTPDRPQRPDEERPVLTGLVALVGVGVAVGLILGVVALIGVKVSGIGNGSETANGDTNASLYLPKPARTSKASGPLITLDASATPSEEVSEEPSETPTESPSDSPSAEDGQITLSAGTTSVAPMEQIDLSGVYPDGEGAVLQVQKYTAGAWQDFPVTVVVSNRTFSTYVQTSTVGVNKFRVIDTDSQLASNAVRVTVG